MFQHSSRARAGAPGWGPRGPEDAPVWVGGHGGGGARLSREPVGASETTISEAVANRELSASREIKRVPLKTSTSSSTRQTVSPINSDAKSSDEDSGPRHANKGAGVDSGPCREQSSDDAEGLEQEAPRRPAERPPGGLPSSRAAAAAEEDDSAWDDGVYTVMIRQIPRHYTQLRFLAEMSCCGFGGLVDFIYFPFDIKRGTNVGYGFVNFTDPRHAQAFRHQFDHVYVDMDMKMKEKPLRMHPASVQGYRDNFAHFAQSKASQKTELRHCPIFMPRGCWLGLPEEIQQELLALRDAFGARQQVGAPAQAPRPSRPAAEPARNRGGSAVQLEEPPVACPPEPPGLRPGAREGRGLGAPAREPRAWGREGAAANPRLQAWGYELYDPAAQGLVGRGGCPAAARAPAPRPLASAGPPGLLQPGLWQHTAGDALWGDVRAGGRPAAALAPPLPRAELGNYHQLEEQKQRLLSELAAVHEEQRSTLERFMSASPAVNPVYLPLPPTASRFGGAS